MDTKEFAESAYLNVQLVEDSPTKTAVILDDACIVETEFEKGKKIKKIEMNVEIDKKYKIYSSEQCFLPIILTT